MVSPPWTSSLGTGRYQWHLPLSMLPRRLYWLWVYSQVWARWLHVGEAVSTGEVRRKRAVWLHACVLVQGVGDVMHGSEVSAREGRMRRGGCVWARSRQARRACTGSGLGTREMASRLVLESTIIMT